MNLDHTSAETTKTQIDLEHLLDNGPWTPRQKVIVLLAALTIVMDGMDIQMMAFAIPSIAVAWHVARSSFASVLGLGLIGVALGTLAGGVIGDRFGRRTALLMSVLLFSVATLSTSLAGSITVMLMLRFLAGVGIGGAIPNATTISAEYTPRNRRPLAVTLTIICIPVGGLIAGVIASHVLLSYSWRLLFVIGGGLPLLLLTILWLRLPESARYLARDPQRIKHLQTLMKTIGRPIPTDASLVQSAPAAGNASVHKVSLRELFADGLGPDTILLWCAFLCSMSAVYLVFNWLPSVLAGGGFTPVQAGRGLTYYNLGGIFGALCCGVWISSKGSRIPVLLASSMGVLSALLVTRSMHISLQPTPVLYAMIVAHGVFVNAVQTALYVLATQLYATRIRATGAAAAFSTGRIGAILSAFFGAFTLRLMPGTYFVLLASCMGCVFIAMVLFKRHIQAPAPAG